MIIKFKARKNKSIYSSKQLVSYILLDKGKIEHPFAKPIVLQNINRLELDTIHKDFLENHKYQTKRKDGNAILHEIIAISKEDKTHITIEILQDMMYKYIDLRGAQNALVLAKSHENHIHFMIGNNELRSSKSLRMSHEKMKKLLRDFELWHKKKYPQLEHSLVHTVKERKLKRDIAQENRNNRREKEYAMKMRTGGKMTQKEVIAEMVNELLQRAGNFEQLVKHIEQTKGLEIYSYRGKIRGILFQNRKWRFSTLNVSKDRLSQLEKVQSRLKQLSLIREMHKATREKELER